LESITEHTSPNPVWRQGRFPAGGVVRRWSDGSGQFPLITISVPNNWKNYNTLNFRIFLKGRHIFGIS
jgi:hypothetical protein